MVNLPVQFGVAKSSEENRLKPLAPLSSWCGTYLVCFKRGSDAYRPGKADMLGVFAEFETNLRRERQIEGIAKAKAAGVYKGRPASIDAASVRELKMQGMGPTEIAKALKIGRASVYRVLDAAQ